MAKNMCKNFKDKLFSEGIINQYFFNNFNNINALFETSKKFNSFFRSRT